MSDGAIEPMPLAEGDVHGGVGGLHFPPRPRPVPSRWRSSPTTFGPIGRVLTTVFAFLPMFFFLITGLFFWLMVTLATVPLLYSWLRDTWRKV